MGSYKRGFITVSLVVILLLLAGGGYWILSQQPFGSEVKTYRNSDFNFEFDYPASWQIEARLRVQEDEIFVRAYDPSSSQGKSFVVEVFSDERSVPPASYQGDRYADTIGGVTVKTYVTKPGFGCGKEEGYGSNSCGAFHIPIEGNGKWFVLSGTGARYDDTIFKKILRSFKFTH